MYRSKVAVIKTDSSHVVDDYRKVMELVNYRSVIDSKQDTIIKLNLSWTKYFPACSSQPWQVEGVVKTLIEGGYSRERLFPLENKTVVTNPWKGAKNNRWLPVLDKYGLLFTALPEVEWTVYNFKEKLLRLNEIFPEGIEIPKMYIGRQIIHLPTVKTHGHSTTTGAVKNAFGGLLKEVRHYAHKYIHEALVDLMIMQKELHPRILAVMDGTVCGDGAGPRTMIPQAKNLILASADSVAVDSAATDNRPGMNGASSAGVGGKLTAAGIVAGVGVDSSLLADGGAAAVAALSPAGRGGRPASRGGRPVP